MGALAGGANNCMGGLVATKFVVTNGKGGAGRGFPMKVKAAANAARIIKPINTGRVVILRMFFGQPAGKVG